MVTKRIEIRLDEEAAEALSNLVEERQSNISEVVREALRLMDDEAQRERRRRIVDEIAAMNIEEMPDPDELARQMDAMYDLDLP